VGALISYIGRQGIVRVLSVPTVVILAVCGLYWLAKPKPEPEDEKEEEEADDDRQARRA